MSIVASTPNSRLLHGLAQACPGCIHCFFMSVCCSMNSALNKVQSRTAQRTGNSLDRIGPLENWTISLVSLDLKSNLLQSCKFMKNKKLVLMAADFFEPLPPS